MIPKPTGPKLILITGAPGVGKTTVARLVFKSLSNCAWLDGDDVWRMNPFRADSTTIPIVLANIRFVLRNYISGGFDHVILSWVLHQQSIIDTILQGLEGLSYRLFVFTLVCDEPTLASRLQSDVSRGQVSDLPFARLGQSRELHTSQVDTTGRSPDEIVREIMEAVTGYESPGEKDLGRRG